MDGGSSCPFAETVHSGVGGDASAGAAAACYRQAANVAREGEQGEMDGRCTFEVRCRGLLQEGRR